MVNPLTFLNPTKQESFNPMPIKKSNYKNKSITVSKQFTSLVHPTSKLCCIALVCMVMNLSVPGLAAAQPKAFACAQGFGATATGGRGGDVYHVTNLSDKNSPGTLRYGIQSAKGPRTIVFDVGGIIHMNSILKVRTDNLTIAGQTAPGGGITLSGYPFYITDKSDVIIRYIRFRVGDYNAKDPTGGTNGNGNMDLKGEAADAIQILNSDRIILDHISASWSMDENVVILDSKNITLQHSIVSEALYHSFHPKGAHSMGLMLFAGAPDSELAKGKGGCTIYQNLIAHNYMRNATIGGTWKVAPGNSREFLGLDFTNNVVYNWGKYSGHTGRPNTKANYINNYFIAGHNTSYVNLNSIVREYKESESYIYFAGNYMDKDKDSNHDGKPVGSEAFSRFEPKELLTTPLPFPVIDDALSAKGAYQNILTSVGASLSRDNVDRRIINELIHRDGSLIDSQDEVGGMGHIARGFTPTDTDRDGMPDNWEVANDLDPTDASDRNRTDLSKVGYTNLEVYLDSIVASAGHCKVESNVVEPPFNQNNDTNDIPPQIITNEPNQGSACPCSIWDDSDKPGTANENDSGAVELGVKFKSDEDGVIEGIRFYKSAENTGKHVANLWTSTGKLLASATFTGETSSGWQQANFANPVAISKDTVYVASYFAPKGHYANDNYVFKNSGVSNGPLHLLQNGVSGVNGVYAYGNSSSFPSSTWLYTNYWVDVVFNN